MSLAAVINKRVLLTSVRGLPTLSRLPTPVAQPSTWKQPSRFYSRKTKTKIQIETSELENEIQQLEKIIAEQERKLAAKRAYEESIRESKSRSEAAQSVYKSLTTPAATTPSSSSTSSSTTKQISGNPFAQSYLPETFLQDLKLTFLDTRGAKEDTIKQLQTGLPSAQDLAALSSAEETEENQRSENALDAASEKDVDALAFERVRKVGVDKWNQLIHVNALEGNTKNAEEVIKLMEEVGVQPDIETFGHLTEAYANAGDLTNAQETVELMLKNGLVPPMHAYNSLMKIHVKRRDISSAFQVFEALKKHHNPDVNVFTNLVKGCLRSGEYDLGWKVFDQMQHSGATPVESTYSLMIHACAKTDQVEKALDIFRTYPNRKLQPTDATFNSLIHACAMRPQYFATAFALLNEMQSIYGFEPDIMTYNTLLFACSKRQDLLTARRVFQKVVQLDSEGVLKLDGVTVTNFLWCVTEWKEMSVHLKNLRMHGKQPLEQAKIEDSTITSTVTSSGTDISIRPTYFLLPSKPPANEAEALAEGESVFSWFVARSAEEFPFTAIAQDASTTVVQDAAEETDSLGQESAIGAVTLAFAPSQLPLPRPSRQSPIRTRLLNAYLAMYVRHQDMTKSTEIYRDYFNHFQRKRDSWTYSTMLEGCYHWKNVDLGAEVFRDWRDWRKSTGKLTEKRTRMADYQCYRRMINLLARTNHLDESIALLEELSIAATPTNTRLRSAIASAPPTTSPSTTTAAYTSSASASASLVSSPASSPASASALASSTALSTASSSSSLAFLKPIQDEAVLPIYPKLKDFPVVYTKTWELEDEAARKLVLRLCHGKVDGLGKMKKQQQGQNGHEQEGESDEEEEKESGFFSMKDKRQARYQKSLRNTSIKWKGEHPQEKGFHVSSRRMKELERDVSGRGQDQHRPGPRRR